MVIGVLAVLTIPNILQSWEEREIITRMKKTYSMLQSAYSLAVIDNGSPETWQLSNVNSPINMFKKYLNIIKDCEYNQKGCFATGKYGRLNETSGNYTYTDIDSNSAAYKILLKDNIALSDGSISPNCTGSGFKQHGNLACAHILVDLNGPQKPNKLGYDLHYFALTKKGIFPIGGQNDGQTTYYHDYGCKNPTDTGVSCTQWVIERGNMDYLHKTNVKWDN